MSTPHFHNIRPFFCNSTETGNFFMFNTDKWPQTIYHYIYDIDEKRLNLDKKNVMIWIQ